MTLTASALEGTEEVFAMLVNTTLLSRCCLIHSHTNVNVMDMVSFQPQVTAILVMASHIVALFLRQSMATNASSGTLISS